MLLVLVIAVLALSVTAFVVFVERGQRRITVNYAKRQVGRRMYAGQSSHLPLKLNMAGVIPPIFASSIILFPATLGGWFGAAEGMTWLRDLSTTLSPGQPLYVMFYAGAIIPGIRPGDQTARYIDGVMTRLTFWGAAYITAVALLPEFMIVQWGEPFIWARIVGPTLSVYAMFVTNVGGHDMQIYERTLTEVGIQLKIQRLRDETPYRVVTGTLKKMR